MIEARKRSKLDISPDKTDGQENAGEGGNRKEKERKGKEGRKRGKEQKREEGQEEGRREFHNQKYLKTPKYE